MVKLINDAVKLHYKGKYDASSEKWNEVLRLNANYELSYVGIGKALLRKGEYKEAMKNFKLGYNRTYYSKAFKLYREEIVGKYFGVIVVVILCIFLIPFIYRKVWKPIYLYRRRRGDF